MTFLGRIPRSDVIERMRTADVFVFPSLRDSAGWAVAEAAACGLPVVCLDRGGPPTIVGGGVRVTTVDATVGELARRIASVAGTTIQPAFPLEIRARAEALWNVVANLTETVDPTREAAIALLDRPTDRSEPST